MPTVSKRLLWLGVILALLVGVPFLNKPFQIDDTVVLRVAEQITHHPLRPFSADIQWFDDPRPLFRETTNPPFVSYWAAPVVRWFGFSEVPLHLKMMAFLLILGVAMAWLSARFAGGSPWPALFVMLSPAVVVSGNVMRDVPLAALSAAAAALFIAGVDRRRWPLALAGGLVAGLAILTKYSGAVLVPVLVLYALLQRRGRYALWMLVALGLLGLWSLQNELVQGRTHLGYLLAERLGGVSWQDRFYATWVILGACMFMLPALAAGRINRRGAGLIAGAAVVAALALYGARLHNHGPVGWQCALWVTTGAAMAFLLVAPGLAALARAFRDPDAADTFFLAAWLGAVVLFGVLFVMFQAVRHLIPAVAPLALLGVRLLPLRARWLPVLLGVLLGAQAIVAFAVAAADYEYAATYRDFARAAQRLERPGREIWFQGNWGWQRYALSAGFRLLAEHGALPRPGDLLLVPERVHKGPLPEGLEPRLSLVEEKTYQGRIPIHTMDGFQHASFYAVVGRLVPYYFTRERTLETFKVYRVKREGARVKGGGRQAFPRLSFRAKRGICFAFSCVPRASRLAFHS